jgi:hypothetical protein
LPEYAAEVPVPFAGGKMSRLFIFVSAFFMIAGALPGFAAEKAKNPPRIESLSKASMQALFAASEMPRQNEVLVQLTGEWNFDLTFRANKNAAPELSTGYAVNKMIFDNLFLSSDMNVLLNIGGQNIPYKGLGYIGYDTDRKVFSSVWLDAAHTGMTTGAGEYDKSKKTLEQSGKLVFPLMKMERKYRTKIAFIDSETYRMTLYLNGDDGKEYKVVEIVFHRKK